MARITALITLTVISLAIECMSRFVGGIAGYVQRATSGMVGRIRSTVERIHGAREVLWVILDNQRYDVQERIAQQQREHDYSTQLHAGLCDAQNNNDNEIATLEAKLHALYAIRDNMGESINTVMDGLYTIERSMVRNGKMLARLERAQRLI